jgi:MoaA/NifB/PqqE/SkfB family radical SAM enzyme
MGELSDSGVLLGDFMKKPSRLDKISGTWCTMVCQDPTPFQTRSKLLTLYASQVQFIQDGGDPYPVQVEVNISDYCSQSCQWCISTNIRDRPYNLDIDAAGVRNFFQDFKRFGGKAVGWSGGGEPTSHPKFHEALKLVSDARLQQGLLTHGAFRSALIEPIVEYCQWIRISIDTHDPNAYAFWRGAKPTVFNRVVENARSMAERNAYVGLNMNVAEWNKDHIENLYDLACSLGVRYLQIRPTLPTPFPHGDELDYLNVSSFKNILARLEVLKQRYKHSKTELLISYDKFHDVQKPDGGRTDLSMGYQGCKAHHMFIVLNCNGDVSVCMYQLFDKRFALGNVYKESLEEIWQSEQRQKVLQFCSHELDHKLHHCQVCCKGHEINKILFNRIENKAASGVTNTSPFL